MRKLQFIVGPMVAGAILSAAAIYVWHNIIPALQAVTVPVTFTDGSVLTAAQLNSNNTSIYNAFNGHNHDGSDGEPSTLAFTSASASFTASGDITFNGATSSLEADGTTATDVFIDQNNKDVTIGDGTDTGEETLTIRAGTGGNAALGLRINNNSANEWKILNDNSGDHLSFYYGGTRQIDFNLSGGITTGGSATTNSIAWEMYQGTTCTASSAVACNTTVDSTAPGSGVPYAFTCMVNNGGTTSGPCGNNFFGTGGIGGGGSCINCEYDSSSDDLILTVVGDADCDAFKSRSYRCIVHYDP